MNSYGVRVIAIAALISGPIVAGCTSASTAGRTRALAATGTALPGHIILAQSQAPAPSAPTTPVARPPAPEARVGLPRMREYRAIPELRDIYFDVGKATIRPGDVKVLDANAAWLLAHPDQLVLIEGHCDVQGVSGRKNELNMALGERRAQAAMNHLIAQGVQASRIITLSYGEERPLCSAQDERCWSQNRRSRFLVKPR